MRAFSRAGRRPFTTNLALPAILLALGLAACKDEPKVVVTPDGATRVITAPGGSTVNVAKDGDSLELTTALPAYAPAYPGARLRTQVTGSDKGENGGVLVFETGDPIVKVAAFYDARAAEQKVKPVMVVNDDDSAVRIFAGPDGNDRQGGALVAISRTDDGKATKIVITAGMDEGVWSDAADAGAGDKHARRDGGRPIRLQ